MNLTQAKKYIRDLHKRDLLFHFDDGAIDCLYYNKLCTLKEAMKIDVKIDKIYASNLDWGKYECPIGYVLHLLKFNKED